MVEDDYPCTVARTGHGLQRAFILTMLQHLALAQTPANAAPTGAIPPSPERKLPDLVLAVEEPELYQHPNRQRHFARILLQLSSGKTPGVADNTQVIYSTHSPLFVGIDRMDQIRLLRKTTVAGRPKITKVVSTTTNEIAEILWRADGEPREMYTGETLLPRLQSIMTPWMSEGFFSRVAVLVEGEDDRAAVLGMASAMGHDLESSGFSVIPCGGKASMDRPIAIFRTLGVTIYPFGTATTVAQKQGPRTIVVSLDCWVVARRIGPKPSRQHSRASKRIWKLHCVKNWGQMTLTSGSRNVKKTFASPSGSMRSRIRK